MDTPDGERMRLTAAWLSDAVKVSVVISRPEGDETLPLLPQARKRDVLISADAPAEPHEFNGQLILRVGDHEELLPFRMVEPAGHIH